MASKQKSIQQQGELKLGDELEDGFEAIANRKAIRDVGKLMKAIGNKLNARTEARQALEKKEKPNSGRAMDSCLMS